MVNAHNRTMKVLTYVIACLMITTLLSSTNAQMQSAQVDISCTPEEIFLDSFPDSLNNTTIVNCMLSNPTSYEEKVEFNGSGDNVFGIDLIDGDEFIIPAGESINVNVSISVAEGTTHATYSLIFTATVTELGGMPPVNVAEESVNILGTVNQYESYEASYDSPLSFTVVLSNQSQNTLDSIRVTNNGNYDALISINYGFISDVLRPHNLSISTPVVRNIIAVDGNSSIQLVVGSLFDATLNTSTWETLQNGSKRLNLSSSVGIVSQLDDVTCYQCTQMLDVTLEIFVVESLIDEETNDEETVVSESSEVPFVGFLATLSVFMLAVVFINNEQEVL